MKSILVAANTEFMFMTSITIVILYSDIRHGKVPEFSKNLFRAVSRLYLPNISLYWYNN